MAGNTQTAILMRESVSLLDVLAAVPPALISLVGGGGKTSIMFALAAEAVRAGFRVITTTTTRILPPGHKQCRCTIVEEDPGKLTERVIDGLNTRRHITAARAMTDDGKLLGLLPETIHHLQDMKLADFIINEADGANRLPVKAPNATEPVIPESTDMVLAVVGMDGLGARLGPKTVFRPELVGALTGLAQGETIDLSAIATLLTNNRGIIQYAPAGAAIVPFLNKMDLVPPTVGVELARDILRRSHPQITRVVMGALRRPRLPFLLIQRA